jgi:hypothetical protein
LLEAATIIDYWRIRGDELAGRAWQYGRFFRVWKDLHQDNTSLEAYAVTLQKN